MRHAWNAYKDELIGRLLFLRETLNTGVSEADISAAEQVIGVSFPESLKSLYLDSNGDNEEAACGMIMGFHFLTLEQVVSECQHWSGIAQDKDLNALETVRNFFNAKSHDFITAVDEKNIILVRELKPEETYDDLEKVAETIVDMLSPEEGERVNVAFGTVVGEIRDVSRSYKEAKMALDVGKIFFREKNVVGYSRLGIGRLIFQLPMPLCRMFIREIFEGKSPDEFDEETLTTINKFFENNLNVSETSRQLYIHRNTLVYRLDKLQKQTGLDLRVFEDAITFKIALMVVKYMKYMENQDY